MARKTVLVVLVAPLWLILSGCAQTANTAGNAGGNAGANTGAILGQAVQVALAAFAGANGQAAPQPIASSVTSFLPGGFNLGTGVGNQPAANPFDPQPLTLQSGVTGGATAADNAFSLASTAAQIGSGKANDGRLTLTQYGGPTDRTPDANTQARIGNRDNTLRPSSLALAPNLIREYGLKGGEAIYVKTSRGNYFLGTYDDTTGNTKQNNVIDVYDPTDRLGQDNFIASIPPGGWQLAIGPRNV